MKSQLANGIMQKGKVKTPVIKSTNRHKPTKLNPILTQPKIIPQRAMLSPVNCPGFWRISFNAIFPVMTAAIAPSNGTMK